MELLSLGEGGGDNQVVTIGEGKEIGYWFDDRMGEDKDVYGRNGSGDCVGYYVLLICYSKCGNHSFFALSLAPCSSSLPHSGPPLARMLL